MGDGVKLMRPIPSYCIKTGRIKGGKLFINMCHAAEIAEASSVPVKTATPELPKLNLPPTPPPTASPQVIAAYRLQVCPLYHVVL